MDFDEGKDNVVEFVLDFVAVGVGVFFLQHPIFEQMDHSHSMHPKSC